MQKLQRKQSFLVNFVEDTLLELGENPVLCRSGREFWEFHHGSALIRVFIYKKDYLVVTSPLNKLPKTKLGRLLAKMKIGCSEMLHKSRLISLLKLVKCMAY